MYYVYLLKLDKEFNKEYYIGCTSDLKKRFFQHRKGQVYSTKDRNPVLLYYESYINKNLAYEREKGLKNSGSVYMALLKRLKLK